MSKFVIDINLIEEKPRKNGVSGIMRVKNDAEFVKASIYSCIDALDELIIVYNDCTDNSPTIIKEIAHEFPSKIKVYDYNYQIYAWNLTSEEIEKIFNGKIDARNTLYGYYNYALSKTTKRYAMKIDADQIYFTHKLKEICDAYRSERNDYFPLISYINVFNVNLKLKIQQKYGIKISLINNNRTQWDRYYRDLLRIIRYAKPNISLYGINSIIYNDSIYISLGKNIYNGISILGPLNGGGDHPIFKVTNKTHFIPFINKAYNILNHLSQSVIERLIGISPLFIGGLCWIHLNAYRLKIRDKTITNLNRYPHAFTKLESIRSNILQSSDDLYANNNIVYKYIIQELDDSVIKMIHELVQKHRL